ncbi:MAG TPA: alpha-glucuronidase family glycosyl hydrolase, partial [Terriglobales bacterium]|nr:alpha-glucuronidase family glycosyl hydrolase [Terriglobales bacterium]
MKHVFLFAMVLAAPFLAAESGIDAWLRYAPVADDALPRYASLPASAVVLGNSVVLTTAQKELIRGLRGMLARTVRADTALPAESAMVLGTLRQLRAIEPSFTVEAELPPDGFWLVSRQLHRQPCLIVAAENDRGVLYGVFALLAKIARREDVNHLDETQRPFAPIRWVNQWDNVNGSIERGYGGGSIFFENGAVRSDLSRAAEFARLLASVGINGCTINNVNANPTLLDPGFIPQLARIAEAFRPWGVRFAVAIDLSSPKVIGGLDTFDPVDPRVAAWWQAKFDEIYRQIPDFAGVVVKADSEGRLGPAEYDRTPADGANVVARALKPHGGLVFYRAFVYNHHLDWRNPKNDRARAAYDIFHPLDGKFDDNVVIQIKYGPIDFQVREPVSPLFGGLEQTNQAIELQIAQEYTGQQRHLCFWVPMWKEVLDFDLRVNGRATPVKNIVSGRSFHRPTGGFVGVSNVGMDANWLGSQLAMA